MSIQESPVKRESKFIRALKKFLQFMMNSGICTLLDLGVFYCLQKWAVPRVWLQPVAIPPLIADVGVLCATIVARICSSTVNFLLNRRFVFKKGDSKGAVGRYILLAAVMMLIGGLLVGRLIGLLPKGTSPFLTTVIKAFVDTVLFVFNFFIQKAWVFPQKKQTEDKKQ